MTLRKLEFEDLHIRLEWMNHPNIYKNMHYEIPVMLEKTICWFEQNQNKDNRIDVAFVEDNQLLAMGGLTHIDRIINKAELYIFVDPYLQKKGIGTQATKLLCNYGFEYLKLNKIYLETNEDNYAAQRVYEKCGFKVEGILRQEYKTFEGTLKNRLYYGLIKGELNES